MMRRLASFLRAFTGVGRRLWRRPGLSLWLRSSFLRRRRRLQWRSCGFFMTSVLVAGVGMCFPAASALEVGTAPLHTMSRSFILTPGSAWCWWLVVSGFRGLASLGPFLGAPAGSPGQVKYTGGSGSGAWHPLSPSRVPSVVFCTTLGSCGGGSARALAGGQIVVCQCHRSGCVWKWPHGVLPLVQFLDKVADMPVASLTGTWGRQCCYCVLAVTVLTLGAMSLLCWSSFFLGAFSEFR